MTDETCGQVTELYQQEQGNLATGGSSATQHMRAASEAAYQKRAESLLVDENCYKVVIVSVVVFLLAWIMIALASLSLGCCEMLFSFTGLIADALFTLSTLIHLEYLVNTFFLGFSLPKLVSLPLNCILLFLFFCGRLRAPSCWYDPLCIFSVLFVNASSVDSGSLRHMLLFRTEGSSWNPT